MALTVRAMASAAQGVRRAGMFYSDSLESSNFYCKSRISGRASGGVVCKKALDGLVWKHLRWNANFNANSLPRSLGRTRRRGRSQVGSWRAIQVDMQLTDDADGMRVGVRKARSAATDVSSVSHNSRDFIGGEKLASDGEKITNGVNVIGRPKKSKSSGVNGSCGGKKKKKSTEGAKDDERLNLKVDGFVTDYSDSDLERDAEDSEDEFEVDISAYTEKGNGNSRTSDASLNGDTRVSGSVRERNPGQEETDLRYMFLEAIMEKARKADVEGVEEALTGMSLAGLDAGPRAYYGLTVAYARSGDPEGAVQALKKAVQAGVNPLPESMLACVRLYGSTGQPQRGKEILAAMEKLNYNPRVAWLTLVEELLNNSYLQEANEVYIEGLEGGLRGTDVLFDRIVEANSIIGDHANCISVLRLMEYGGRMSTTFHYNCLLRAQCMADVPDIIAMTFETMQYGRDEMKPDTESYNWVLQSYVRHKFGDRCQEVIDLLGEMVEDHKRVQPNQRTYALLVECFSKYDHFNEAVRHFRALVRNPGSTTFLFNEGHGRDTDPLSLYIRGLCLEGRAGDLVEVLESMVRDNQPLPARALLVNKRGRTLVSSWIEPLQQEPDLGYDIDYVARFLAEGGGDGTRKRFTDSVGGRFKAVDDDGFAYAAPLEVSYKSFLTHMRKNYNLRLLRKLRLEGVRALGPGATEADLHRVIERLKKDTRGDVGYQIRKPKAASKMLVSELKDELEAQGLPTEGTRPVLYQRVQKARRINKARGRPLWVPPTEDELDERHDEEIDMFMERLTLKNENSEFWRKRFIGGAGILDEEESLYQASADSDEETFADDDDEDDDDEDELQVTDSADDLVEDGGEEDVGEPPEMLAMQLLKNKKEEVPVVKEEDREGSEWLGLTLDEKITFMKERGMDESAFYTIADVWGWTWEQEIRDRVPEDWSQEKEVQLAIEIMLKVQALGGIPTINDMGILVRAAMRTPWPEALVSLLQHSHKLGYAFGSKLYAEAVRLCLSLGEKDAAINIISDMEDMGVAAPPDLLTDVLEETQFRQISDVLAVEPEEE
ncbi:uncharacterized protein [Physcomitrium patens]|uniref:SAP domain-containing protein n=1 Tax=Physcomitrium patens TaxID=3218 RepID=A0A2K1L7J1_PHYPA|nr:uncharacterized protein LOC112283726 [Physcomitrium patens]PNR61951.1 hypothetical protein PHYPA_000375 [Physcomitrium patens]|eukprot:XP_024378551.1 uncharacterized protein LOC112283726 [Physcomitrella patens]